MAAPQLSMFEPRVRAGSLVPRAYQVEADGAIDTHYAGRPHQCADKDCSTAHRSTLVVQATGLGKTVLFCIQAKKRGNGLVLVHRDSLARQAAKKLAAATGETIGIEKAERTAWVGTNYVVASVQSLHAQRLKGFVERFNDTFDFIVTDEAHRSVAPSYRRVYDAFPGAKLLGVTATADRSDGVAMGSVYDSVAHRYEIIPATADAWLTPVDYVPLYSEVDLNRIDLRGKEIDQHQLDDAVAAEAGRIARAILDHARDQRLVVFTPGVKTAHTLSQAMNLLVPNMAAAVDGDTPDDERERLEEQHRAGEFTKLVNCNIYTEGYDDPNLDGIVDTAKSNSRLRVMQRLGRATRLYDDGTEGPQLGDIADRDQRAAAIAASPKPRARWYDLVCNGDRHSPVGPLDLLAGNLPDDVRKAAKKILEKEGGAVDKAVAEARARVEERDRAMRAAAAARKAKSRVGKVRSIFELAGVKHMTPAWKIIRPEDYATVRQIKWMKANGLPVPREFTKAQYKRLRGKDAEQERRGLCRLGGIHWLSWYGIAAHRMPSATAKRIQQAIIANGRQALHPETLRALMTREVGSEG